MFEENMLIDDRAVDVLLLDEDIRDIDRFRAMISEFFFVWLGALLGIVGASSLDALCREGAPK
jgi:hypothetical protein